ncbi:MAG: hypothetical protein BAJALOKI3v1_50125 [Promethearchaeota archaeon]|nr:MAG: hypothetical protein BAJALOKI3v1_50125 [Candidatus Lokiarchaeota archaeon]
MSGDSLNDGGNDYVTIIGSGKTALQSNAVYLWTNNGVRLKPVASQPSGAENGTFYYNQNTHKFTFCESGSMTEHITDNQANVANGYLATDFDNNNQSVILIRRGLETTLSTEVLEPGEMGYSTDTHILAIGDGETAFSGLPSVTLS